MSANPHKEKSGETDGGIRSLVKELWPLADRIAWEAASRPGVRLKRGGAASHLKPVTQNDLARRYGYFLDFLSRSERLDPEAKAGAHVTLEKVEQYVEELKGRVGSVTVYGSIHKLRRITQLIAPERDITWLTEIERDLLSQMRPKSKSDRIVLSEVIIEAGLTLIAEAELGTKLRKLTRARMVRNGLMLALLAHSPIRLKNFAALEIRRSIVKIDNTWWILLEASETKEKRADERPIEEDLGEAIDKYLDVYRPILTGGVDNTNALWIGINGEAMAQCSVAEVVTETTRSTLGVAINPHLFRTAAATTTAVHAGDKPHLGSALLHHRHPTVTQENYNRASSISAGRAYREITQRVRLKIRADKLRASPPCKITLEADR
jgi:site-specific recombinase XerD